MNAKELVLVLDQLGCPEVNIGVGKGIHDLIKEESGESKNCLTPEYAGRKFYLIEEFKDDEILLQIRTINNCVVTYDRLVEINKSLSGIMRGSLPVTKSEQYSMGVPDNLSGLIMMRNFGEITPLHVIRK